MNGRERPPALPDSLAPLARRTRQSVETIADRTESVDSRALARIHRAIEDFHRAFLDSPAAAEVRCRRGCANCCTQMVFGVHAFEIERLGQILRDADPKGAIEADLERRVERYDAVRRANPRRPREDLDSWTERVAVAFHAEGLPCVFLEADGSCGVHDARPYACRRHFAISDPEYCGGEGVTRPEHRGFQLEPDAEFDALLDRVDARVPFEPDTDQLDLALLRWLRARSI